MEKIYYKIVYGYNVALIESESEVKDHQALVDVLIDYLENIYGKNNDTFFICGDYTEDEEGTIYQGSNVIQSDCYVIGGNHCLPLIHNGNFFIDQLTDTFVIDELKKTKYVDKIDFDEYN